TPWSSCRSPTARSRSPRSPAGGASRERRPRTSIERQAVTPTESRPGDPKAKAAVQARVLAVDDEPAVLEVFHEYLGLQGYAVSTAPSGEEAVRVIPELRPDVILTDINLPGLSGLEVMRFAKSVDAEVGVIVVTGHASASNAIEALRQGAFNYITK